VVTDHPLNELPLVSIVIDSYNYARFLREAIDSALGQTYSRVEVVVVDDGSTDDSPEIILSYEDRVVPVLKQNGGQGSAFNAGVAASQGDIVTFLDSDDYLLPQAVEQVVAAWEPDVAQIQYRVNLVDACGRTTGVYPPPDMPLDSGDVWRSLLKKGYYVHPPTSGLSFSRAALEKILPIPEAEWRTTPDGYLTTLAPFHGRVVALERVLGVWRHHGDNTWGSEVELDVRKFREMLDMNLLRQATLVREAGKLGHEIPDDLSSRDPGNLQRRLILLRLAPQEHPFPSDSRLHLAYRGVISTWRYSDFKLRKRLLHVTWFVWVALFPLPLARLAINFLYAPATRPKFLEWARRRVVGLG
jgi:hypothetical protein